MDKFWIKKIDHWKQKCLNTCVRQIEESIENGFKIVEREFEHEGEKRLDEMIFDDFNRLETFEGRQVLCDQMSLTISEDVLEQTKAWGRDGESLGFVLLHK